MKKNIVRAIVLFVTLTSLFQFQIKAMDKHQISVELEDGTLIKGTLLAVSDDSLLVRSTGNEYGKTIYFREINAVSIRNPRRYGDSFILGTLGGFATGYIIALISNKLGGNSGDLSDFATLGLVKLTTGAGILIGLSGKFGKKAKRYDYRNASAYKKRRIIKLLWKMSLNKNS